MEYFFEPTKKQEEFGEAVLSGKYSFCCYGGAMGGGKSYIGLFLLVMLCKFHPGSKWIVIRESMPTLKKTSLETFKKVCPSNFLKNFNQKEQIAFFNNGSQIQFMAEDYYNDKDFDRFKGVECNGFLLEQIEELNEKLLDVCFIRAGRHKIPSNPAPIVIANVNPTQTWVKKKIYEAYKNKTLPDGWYYLPATIFDNPVLANDANYMKTLTNLEELTYKRLIEGDWDAFAVSNPFAYSFQEQKHIGKIEYNPEYELLLSFDFNLDPITCLVAQHIDERFCFIDAFKLANSNIYDLCDAIVAKFGYYNPVYLITGDATGHNRSALTVGNLNYYRVIKDKLGLADPQMKVKRKNMSPRGLRVLLNSVLQHYSVIIDKDNCDQYISDLKYVEVDAEGDIIKDRSNENRKADLLDCGNYMLETFLPGFLKHIPEES